MNKNGRFAVCTIVVLLLWSTVAAEIPQIISYQGKITESGQAVADGSYTMRFRIYTAPTSGTLRWDSGNQTVQVTDGIFSILLGDSGQPTLNLSFDEDLWILVAFEGVDQTPRQRIVSAGYAYMASGIVPGTEIHGAVTSGLGAALVVENTATSICHGIIGETNGSYGVGVRGVSTNSGGLGVYGLASATTGATYGVYGSSSSSTGYGIYGEVTSTQTGIAYGVYGKTNAENGATYGVYGTINSEYGAGVYGVSSNSGSPLSYGVKGSYSADGDGAGVHGETNATSPVETPSGVSGIAWATSGTAYGGKFASHSTSGRGVYGEAYATSGATFGLYGVSNSTDGRGVYGEVMATSGTTYGVWGESSSTLGRGVYGWATASSGNTYGVYGRSNSTSGRGVYGWVTASIGVTSGLYGYSESTDGRGVYGEVMATSGTTYGVWGESNSTSGRGVYGWATASSGNTYGVYGRSNSISGRGIYGEVSTTTGTTYGVYGESSSNSGYGVYGKSDPTPAADGIGVFGICEPGDFFGLGVSARGQFQAIRGECSTDGSNGGLYYGGYLRSDVSGIIGTAFGVYGGASGGSMHYGVYYEGGMNGSGIVRNTVRTDDGPVSLYVHQATENWFEDFGSGIVQNGSARISLRNDYRKTITSNESHPVKVFVTPTAHLGDWWVDKDSNGFTLIAPEAPDGASFDYRIIGKRKNAEDLRLESTPSGYIDKSLYPDDASVPAEYLSVRRKIERVQESDFE